MDDVGSQAGGSDQRKRRTMLVLLVGVVSLISFFLGFGANWATRAMSEPTVYCLDRNDVRDGRYRLYAEDSGCPPGEICLLTTIHIASQELRATDCSGSRARGLGGS